MQLKYTSTRINTGPEYPGWDSVNVNYLPRCELMGEGEIYQVSAHVPFLLIVKHTVGKFATDT